MPAALVRPYFAWILGGGLFGIVKLAPHVDNLVTQVWDPMLNSWDKKRALWAWVPSPHSGWAFLKALFTRRLFFDILIRPLTSVNLLCEALVDLLFVLNLFEALKVSQ